MRKSIRQVSIEVSGLEDLDAFWAIIHDQLVVRGAASVLFGVLASQRELEHMRLSKALIWKSTHKKEFFEAFDGDSLLDNDRTAEHCLSDDQVFFWHDPAFWEQATPAEKRWAGIERDIGMAIGFTVPSSYHFCKQIGGIGVAMPDVPHKEFPLFWNEEGAELIALCGLLDAGMRGQHLGQLVNLTPYEKECLSWLSVGMRPQQIADKLGRTDCAVERYINSAREKLRARTRDHAVAKAIMLGLIEP